VDSDQKFVSLFSVWVTLEHKKGDDIIKENREISRAQDDKKTSGLDVLQKWALEQKSRPETHTDRHSQEVDQRSQKGKELLLEIPKKEYNDTREIFIQRYENKVYPSYIPDYFTIETFMEGKRYYITHVNRDTKHMIVEASDRTLEERVKPGALPHSEILWHQYHLGIQENVGRSSQEMKFTTGVSPIFGIEHRAVTNGETLAAIDQYVEFGEHETFPFGSKEYFGFIGTPNCKSAAFLAAQHQENLKEKNDPRIIGVTHITAGWFEDARGIPVARIMLDMGVLPPKDHGDQS
jgi:hypothetical protein